MQYDNLMELPKDKRPPDEIIFNSAGDELEEWLDEINEPAKRGSLPGTILISPNDIE
jgi:hypothetical protein